MVASQNLINDFNEKWAGKTLTHPSVIAEKVKHFKVVQNGINALAQLEQANKAEAQKAANEKAAADLKLKKEQASATNQKYMKALGITEAEAVGFNALVEMHGPSYKKNIPDLIEKFNEHQAEAEKYGYPISGFQYALVRDYIDGGYKAVNKALRSGSLSQAQHVYTRLVNDALTKMPKYTGTVKRGANLSPEKIARYQPGHVVTEGAFTSTGIGYKFSGNVHFTVKSNGMRGADFSKGANIHEREVLFKANTNFLVHKVHTVGGTTHIEMEEVESYG
jgi:NACalpha-BTF3-like transcription factor